MKSTEFVNVDVMNQLKVNKVEKEKEMQIMATEKEIMKKKVTMKEVMKVKEMMKLLIVSIYNPVHGYTVKDGMMQKREISKIGFMRIKMNMVQQLVLVKIVSISKVTQN